MKLWYPCPVGKGDMIAISEYLKCCRMQEYLFCVSTQGTTKINESSAKADVKSLSETCLSATQSRSPR